MKTTYVDVDNKTYRVMFDNTIALVHKVGENDLYCEIEMDEYGNPDRAWIRFSMNKKPPFDMGFFSHKDHTRAYKDCATELERYYSNV